MAKIYRSRQLTVVKGIWQNKCQYEIFLVFSHFIYNRNFIFHFQEDEVDFLNEQNSVENFLCDYSFYTAIRNRHSHHNEQLNFMLEHFLNLSQLRDMHCL